MYLRRFLEDKWLPAIRPTIRPTTFHGYRLHVERHLIPHLGSVRLTALTAPKINSFYAHLAAHGRLDGNGGLSAATVTRIHATLHRALRDATRWGHLAENPAGKADPPKTHEPRHLATWDALELRAFLQAVKSDELHPLWLLLATTGMRRGEALGLRWCDVDLDAADIAIRQCVVMAGSQICISKPKTAKGRRVIAIDNKTVAVLRQLRKADRKASAGDLLFRTESGEPLNANEVSKRFTRLVGGAGLPRIRLHDLRHTHATLALAADIHPKIVSERLGHATISLTLDTYSHAIPHMQREAATKIGVLIFGR